MSEASFFYNVRTGAVEEVEQKDKAQDLMGPYPTREAAQDALESARRRTEAWDRQDAEDD